MPRRECESTENIVRAAIRSLPEILAIFERDFVRPPISLLAAGEINVGQMQEIGHRHETPAELTVELAPTADNPAHAEIPQRMSRALSLRTSGALLIHPPR